MTPHEPSLLAGAEVVRSLRHQFTGYSGKATELSRSRRHLDRSTAEVAAMLARDTQLRLYGAQWALRAVAGVTP